MKIINTRITEDGRCAAIVNGVPDELKQGDELRCAGMRWTIDVFEALPDAEPGVACFFLKGNAPPLKGMILRLASEPLGKEEFETYTKSLFDHVKLLWSIDAQGYLETIEQMRDQGLEIDDRINMLDTIARVVLLLQKTAPTRNDIDAVSS